MLKNKFNIKYILFTIISIFFLLNFSFASWDISVIWSITNLLNLIWMPFAIIAGKLYTNDLIYWTLFWMDTILWQVWTVMKTFANFIIWFILILAIFGIFIWKTKNILSILWKITIASILVNMSWFIIWIFLDLSTILLVSVWSFPLSIIWKISSQATEKVNYCESLTINSEWVKNYSQIFTCNKEKKVKIEDFMKDSNKLSWPLIYIWESILKFNDIDGITKTNEKKWDGKKVMSIQFLIKTFMILLFVVPIILLIIIWIIRLFWLWIYIMFSPLIFLDQVFWWKALTQHKALQIKNMIWLTFQPVLVVFAMWIIVIFLATLQTVLTANLNSKEDPAKKSLWICNDNNSLCINTGVILTVEWNLMNKTIENSWWFLWYLILMIMTSILLWSLLKFAFTSNEITGSIATWVYNFAEESLKAVPIIPLWDKGTSIWAMKMAIHKWILKSWFDTKSSEQANKVLDKIYELTWTKLTDLKTTDIAKWENKIRELKNPQLLYKAYWEFINDIKRNNKDLVPANAKNFQQVVANFINAIWNKYQSSSQDNFYNNLWLRKNNKNITDPSKMFEQDRFKQFVSGSIKHNNIFINRDIPNIDSYFGEIISWTAWSDLNRSVWSISWEK